jgi:hypothetical protein
MVLPAALYRALPTATESAHTPLAHAESPLHPQRTGAPVVGQGFVVSLPPVSLGGLASSSVIIESKAGASRSEVSLTLASATMPPSVDETHLAVA